MPNMTETIGNGENKMQHIQNQFPNIQEISRSWMAFKGLIGVTSVRTESDYKLACTIIDALLDVVGDDGEHPLADMLDYLADQIERYEEEHFPIPDASPREVLSFLMEQHELKQEDLSDCAPQSRISDILAGRRAISKQVAKRLAVRFHVHADVFL
jgi:HTH-type transcriptional regulator / antitoxin HigA